MKNDSSLESSRTNRNICSCMDEDSLPKISRSTTIHTLSMNRFEDRFQYASKIAHISCALARGDTLWVLRYHCLMP